MQKSLILATILSISITTTVSAKIVHVGGIKAADKKFMLNTALDGMTEVKLGELGEKNASNERVKDFAAKMVTDHTKANESFKNVANDKGMTLPDNLDAKHEALITKLSKLSGPKFDHAYMDQMLKDHKKVISDLEIEKKNTGEEELKNWCKETLPTIQEHLTIAKEITTSLNKASTKSK